MKRKKSGENEKRKSFALYFFGLVALLSIIGTIVGSAGWTVKIGLLIINLSSTLMMFYTLQEKSVDIWIKVGNKIGIIIKPLRGVEKPISTIIETKPHNIQNSESAANEKEFLECLHACLEQGLTEQNCAGMMNLLEQHASTVNESWKLTANKCRLLALQHQFDEAEALAKVILDKFSDDSEAVSVGHELHCWIEELSEPLDPSRRDSSLEKRLAHTNKGLAACSSKTIHWLNGFVVLVEQRKAGEALRYLSQAILSDKDFTAAYLKALTISDKDLVEEAKKLSSEMKKTIDELIGGEKK